MAKCKDCGGKMGKVTLGRTEEHGILCRSCFSKMSESQLCPTCDNELSWDIEEGKWVVAGTMHYGDRTFCAACAESQGRPYYRELFENMIVSTTPSIEGKQIKSYKGLVGYEVVVGTGIFSEMSLGITDFFGARSGMAEGKLEKARRTCIDAMKTSALQLGANAVVGIGFECTEFAGNRVGIIATGTAVITE